MKSILRPFPIGQTLRTFFAPVCLALTTVVAPAQIMSLYTFDNTTDDTVRGAGGNASVLTGTSAYTTGQIGDAFSFNGSTLLLAPQAGAGLPAYTISAWAYFDTSTPWATIVKNWGDASSGSFHFGLNNNTRNVSNFIGTTSGDYAVVSPSLLNLDTWYHVAVTFGAGFQTLYINGAAVDTESATGTVVNRFTKMSFGAKLGDNQTSVAPANPGWLNGYLDDVAFFNTALTSTEMSAIYTAGLAGNSVSTLGYTYEPYVDPSAAVPEPGTWAAAALLAGGAAFMRWRKRRQAV